MFFLGLIVGGFIGLMLASWAVAEKRGDAQGKPHTDEYQEGYNDGYADGVYETECKYRG